MSSNDGGGGEDDYEKEICYWGRDASDFGLFYDIFLGYCPVKWGKQLIPNNMWHRHLLQDIQNINVTSVAAFSLEVHFGP
jgi:hypothetical protein